MLQGPEVESSPLSRCTVSLSPSSDSDESPEQEVQAQSGLNLEGLNDAN